MDSKKEKLRNELAKSILSHNKQFIYTDEIDLLDDYDYALLAGSFIKKAIGMSPLLAARLSIVPEVGSFVGFKKAVIWGDRTISSTDSNMGIVKLLIPEKAKRSNATGRKCRCSSAKVLSIESLSGKKKFKKATSIRDSSFEYKVGKIVKPSYGYDSNRFDECAPGIHFYITRIEAVNHGQ